MSNYTEEETRLNKMDFGVSFSVTRTELQASKDMKILERLTEECSRKLGLEIGRAKKWGMEPFMDNSALIKTLQVRVYTYDEINEFAEAMIERGRREVLDSLKTTQHNNNEGHNKCNHAIKETTPYQS